MAKMITVRVALAFVAAKNWSIEQMDVKKYFFHDELKETIYMKPPLGLTLDSYDKVCKLKDLCMD
jgi:Reverse transcriptase (RNA-dependent DNA polymerase)